LTFEIVKNCVDEIVTVTDDEISAAILALMEKQKLVAEGAGAVSVAAAMFGKVDLQGKKAVCVVSGGNIDVTILSRVIARGLEMSGRNCKLTLEVADRPGQLMRALETIAAKGGNVTSVRHEHSSEGTQVNGCFVRINLETRNFEHIAQIKEAVVQAGFKLV
jgi:threonine dehydratase